MTAPSPPFCQSPVDNWLTMFCGSIELLFMTYHQLSSCMPPLSLLAACCWPAGAGSTKAWVPCPAAPPLLPGVLAASGSGSAGLLALKLAVDVLVVACPCALGLAAPTALLVASSLGARRGLLLRGGDALERLASINTVALDKTGTLTTGQLTMTAAHPRPCAPLVLASGGRGVQAAPPACMALGVSPSMPCCEGHEQGSFPLGS